MYLNERLTLTGTRLLKLIKGKISRIKNSLIFLTIYFPANKTLTRCSQKNKSGIRREISQKLIGSKE